MTLYFLTDEQCSIVCIYHIVFIDTWGVSTLGPSETIQLRAFMDRFLCGHTFSFLLNIYLGMKCEMLGHVELLFFFFPPAVVFIFPLTFG